MKKIRLAIFISGRGSNARNIISYFKGHARIEVVAIYSNNPQSPLLSELSHTGIVVRCFSKPQLQQGEVLHRLESDAIDFIALAGFLLKIPTTILERYPNKVINIHPSLLPKFGGKGMYGDRVHHAVIESKERHSGITIHYVNQHYDQGAIIFQTSVLLACDETVAQLATKIQRLEHRHFPPTLERTLTLK